MQLTLHMRSVYSVPYALTGQVTRFAAARTVRMHLQRRSCLQVSEAGPLPRLHTELLQSLARCGIAHAEAAETGAPTAAGLEQRRGPCRHMCQQPPLQLKRVDLAHWLH
jgi:hypothetical protein